MASLLLLDGRGTLTDQVYRSLRGAILKGTYPPGQRLPSTRALARDLALSRNIVSIAFEQLKAEGYTEAEVGAGTFVSRELPEGRLLPDTVASVELRNAALPHVSEAARRALACDVPVSSERCERLPYDFRYGEVVRDEVSLREWGRLLSTTFTGLPLGYGTAEGDPELRDAIAGHLRRTRGVRCEAEQVLITTGSQQGLDLTARALLEPGSRVVIEEPHYRGARSTFQAAGARLVTCPTDEDGLDIERAPGEAHSARLIYVTPSHQFPTGSVMSLARRLELLRFAEERNAWILEDDYDSEFRHEGRPIEAAQAHDHAGRVIYAGTFSKILFPALRLGFLVLPIPLIEAFRRLKWVSDRHSSLLEQRVLARFLANGAFDRHVRRTRRRAAESREALVDALGEHFGERADLRGTSAGMHLLAWFDELAVDRYPELEQAAEASGVGLYPVHPCFMEPPERVGLVFQYVGLAPDTIREGIGQLAEAFSGIAT